jgi:hypothetical protein
MAASLVSRSVTTELVTQQDAVRYLESHGLKATAERWSMVHVFADPHPSVPGAFRLGFVLAPGSAGWEVWSFADPAASLGHFTSLREASDRVIQLVASALP